MAVSSTCCSIKSLDISTCIRWLTTICNSSPKGSSALFWPLWAPAHPCHLHWPAGAYRHIDYRQNKIWRFSLGQELAKIRLTNKVGIVNQANLTGGYGQELIEDLANQFKRWCIIGVLPVCMYHMHAVPPEARRGHQIPSKVRTTIWVLDQTSALNSEALHPLLTIILEERLNSNTNHVLNCQVHTYR